MNDAHGLGKPLVVEEFGKTAQDSDHSRRSVRDPHFRSLFDIFQSQRSSGGALKGASCSLDYMDCSFQQLSFLWWTLAKSMRDFFIPCVLIDSIDVPGIAFWEFGSGKASDMSIYPHHSTWKEYIAPKSRELISDLESRAPLSSCKPGKQALCTLQHKNHKTICLKQWSLLPC